MRKKWTLSRYLKRRRIFVHILPIFSIVLAILAVSSPNFAQMGKESLILLGLAVFGLVWYLIVLALFNYFIKKAEKEEKEVDVKDDRIKELEEELERTKRGD